MSFASCCLRIVLMLSLAFGGATPAMAAAAMFDAVPASAHANASRDSHGDGCEHANAVVTAVQADAAGAMHSRHLGATHAPDTSLATTDAQHASHQSGAGCDCCDAGKCNCSCMHGVTCMTIGVATLVSDVPARARVDATLPGAHPEPVRAQLIRPPTLHTA